jgi:hypothetical protein
VNEGEWGVPPGAGVMRDEFGGVTAILIVGMSGQATRAA